MYKAESYKECGELGDFIYEEFKGENIRWAYHHPNYYKSSGQLGSSCKLQPYIEIYK
jgi:hypothetical protein